MLKKRWIFITIISTFILAALAGWILKKDYAQFDTTKLMDYSNETNLCMVCTIDEFSFSKERFDSMMDNPSIILKVRLAEKYKLNNSILSKVEVLEDYLDYGIAKNEFIYIREAYEIVEQRGKYIETNYSLEIPLYPDREYIVNLKESEYSKNIYEFKSSIFSKVQLTGERELRNISEDIVMDETDKAKALQFNLVDLKNNKFVTDAIRIEEPEKLATEYNELQNQIVNGLLDIAAKRK